ncbi:MAG: tetratricopeptide repeat protein [Planctomycetota bacterium]
MPRPRPNPCATTHAMTAFLIVCAVAGCGTPSGTTSPRPGAMTPDLTDAQALAAAGDYDAALTALEAVIAENPTLTAAHLSVGEIHLEQGDHTAAEATYRRAVALAETQDDGSAPARDARFEASLGHGTALQALGRLYDAITAYLSALELRADDGRANARLASTYLELGESRQSLWYARRARAADPASGPARSTLAAALAATGADQEAIREYEAALELVGLEPPLLLGLAESLGKLGRFAEMANTLETAVTVEATAPAVERLGYARFKLRQYDAARDAFRRAIALDASHFPALNGLAVVLLNDYLLGGQADPAPRDEALTLLRRSLQLRPSQPQIANLLARFQ